MRTFAEKSKATQNIKPSKSTKLGRALTEQNRDVHSILHLQRTIGNQAVQRLLNSKKEDIEASSATNTSTRFAHDFSRIPIHAPVHTNIQPKLKVNVPGDIYEQEADGIAEQVMRTAIPVAPQVQQETDKEKLIKRKTIGYAQRQIAPPIVDKVLHTPGQPLDLATRAFMEPRFGHDFSRVRVYTDGMATNAADAVQAQAYTVGRDIVFGGGQYQPTSTEGRQLLAHELTHVVQQVGRGPACPIARVIQRKLPKQTTTPPQLTQQLYSQAIASIASRTGVNATLLAILRRGQVGQRVAGVHSASSTLQVSIPPPRGSTAGATSVPAVRVVFDLEIAPTTTQLPRGAFAAFDDSPATQTTFTGRATATTRQTITRLLRMITKAPTGTNAADTLGEVLVHEGTHMLLAIDRLLSLANIPGLLAGQTGAQTSFNRYVTAAARSSRRSALIASLVAEVNRVFTPSGATRPTITAADANQAVDNVLVRMLEERFAIDQQVAAYPRTVSNATLARDYLWYLLGEETSRTSWPLGSGAQALETAMALFLDDVAAQLRPPPPPTGSGTP